MVPGNSRIYKPKIAVGATAQQRHRCGEVVRVALLPLCADQQPRPSAGEPASRRRHVAHRLTDLTALHRRTADDAGPDTEHTGAQVIGVLEPHPYRAHEGVTLFLRVLTSEIGEFLAQTVGVHREPFTVGMRDLDDEVVRHQRATLRDDGRALVHLTLDRAGDLRRLQLRLESPREGTLHHAFEPALEAL